MNDTQSLIPTNWDARIGLAESIINWRPRCALTALLAAKALDGYTITDLMGIERGYREDERGR
jgi:phage baseplate assembly protein W